MNCKESDNDSIHFERADTLTFMGTEPTLVVLVTIPTILHNSAERPQIWILHLNVSNEIVSLR